MQNKKNSDYSFNTRPSIEISTKTHLLEFSTVTHVVKLDDQTIKKTDITKF